MANGPEVGGSTAGGYDRILAVLDRLATERQTTGWGVRELAEVADETRSGVNRVLQALVLAGLAERTENAVYRSGPRLRVLADRVLRTHPMMAAAPAILAELSDRTESTAILAIHDSPRPQGFVARYHPGTGPVRYNLEPATVIPLHAGAAGQAILAELGSAAIDSGLPAYTENTIVDTAQLAEMIEQTRRRGYALSIGQHFPLAAGLAVPLRTQGLLAAIAVTRARYNTSIEDLLRVQPLVTAATHDLAGAATHTLTPSARSERVTNLNPAQSGAAASRVERFLTALLRAPSGLPVTGRELGRLISANRATATKLLDAAASAGITVPYAGRYVTGPRLLHWAASLGEISERQDILNTIITAVAEGVGEAIGLIEYSGRTNRAVLTMVAKGAAPLQYGLATGVEMPLHAGAAGKAILAHLDPSTVQRLDLTPHTERTITTTAALLRQLQEIRRRGWAIGDGEHLPDAFGIAVPYFIDGAVGGSLTATLPRFRAQEVDLEATTATLSRAAEHITSLLTV